MGACASTQSSPDANKRRESKADASPPNRRGSDKDSTSPGTEPATAAASPNDDGVVKPPQEPAADDENKQQDKPAADSAAEDTNSKPKDASKPDAAKAEGANDEEADEHSGMTTSQRVQASWKAVHSTFTLQQVGDLFYQSLFETHPDLLASLFRGADLPVQAGRLISMLDLAVTKLGDEEHIEEMLVGLGHRHVGYGVLPEHFPPVGEALTETIRVVLGARLTYKDELAWAEVYNRFSACMKKGMEEERLRRKFSQPAVAPSE